MRPRPSPVVLVAAAWLAVVAAVAFSMSSVVLSPLFAVAPLIVAAAASARYAAGFAVVAIALTVALGAERGVDGSGQQLVRVSTVVLVGGAAVILAILRVRREGRLVRITAIADAAQRAIVPTVPSRLAGVAIAARYESATHEARVGGDFYDAVEVADGLRVIIGDVRGKGLEAVQHAARVIQAFRQSAGSAPDVAVLAKQLNARLLPHFGDEDFVTALIIEAAPDGTLQIVNCGHHPAILSEPDGTSRSIDGAHALPLGLADDFPVVSVEWPVRGRLLLYTDGLVEARDHLGNFLESRRILESLQLPTTEQALDRIVETLFVHVHRKELADDLALLLLERLT